MIQAEEKNLNRDGGENLNRGGEKNLNRDPAEG
jgi:hypothetical protein